MKKKKLKVGDIFYLEVLPNSYVFGRILFDVNKQYHKVVDTNDNTIFSDQDYFPYLLMSHNGCQLIEMYKGITDKPEMHSKEILIPRVFTRNIDGDMNILSWGVVGHEAIDYTKIEFPEHINRKDGMMYLDRGELSIMTDISNEADLGVNLKSSISVPVTIGNACLFLQGKADLIPADTRRPNYIKNKDLLYYPELRKAIYEQVGENPDLSYYQLARSKGFDLARFF